MSPPGETGVSSVPPGSCASDTVALGACGAPQLVFNFPPMKGLL